MPKVNAIACPDEHTEQVSLIQWTKLSIKQRPELCMLFAVPNGGARSKATAGKLKAEGVQAGVPDLICLSPVYPFHGLAIEMKRQRGSTTSPEQKDWLSRLKERGYHTAVCKGWLEAKAVIENYLDGRA